jgi:hypothetical protein
MSSSSLPYLIIVMSGWPIEDNVEARSADPDVEFPRTRLLADAQRAAGSICRLHAVAACGSGLGGSRATWEGTRRASVLPCSLTYTKTFAYFGSGGFKAVRWPLHHFIIATASSFWSFGPAMNRITHLRSIRSHAWRNVSSFDAKTRLTAALFSRGS